MEKCTYGKCEASRCITGALLHQDGPCPGVDLVLITEADGTTLDLAHYRLFFF